MKIFDEHHEMFRQAVRAFVQKEVEPHVEAWEQAGEIPKSIWPRMGALGFLGVEYDEKYGGAGADVLTTAVLCEEMARARCASLAMAVGVHTDMASPHLYWTGSEALKEKYLPAICRGEALTAIAVTEPGGGSDVAAIRTRAVRDGDHYVLDGSKMFITNGVLADVYSVIAYYLGHRDEVRAYLKRRAEEAEALRAKIEAECPSVTREELLARRSAREKDHAPTGQ